MVDKRCVGRELWSLLGLETTSFPPSRDTLTFSLFFLDVFPYLVGLTYFLLLYLIVALRLRNRCIMRSYCDDVECYRLGMLDVRPSSTVFRVSHLGGMDVRLFLAVLSSVLLGRLDVRPPLPYFLVSAFDRIRRLDMRHSSAVH